MGTATTEIGSADGRSGNEPIVYSETPSSGFFGTGAYLDALKTGKWSDMKVTGPDGITHAAHRVILCTHSGFFETALSSHFKEEVSGNVEVKFEDPRNVWNSVLDYMYSGRISVEKDTVTALYAMGEQLQIPRLKRFCEIFLHTVLRADIALELLGRTLEFEEGRPLTTIVLAEVSKHFGSLLWNANYSTFPVWVIEELLSREDLNVRYEFQVLYCLVKYAETSKTQKGGNEPAPGVSDLFKHVRLEFLPNQILVDCDAFTYIPRDLLLRGALDRLGMNSPPQSLSGSRSPRRNPRPTYLSESAELATLKEYATLSSSGIQHGDLANAVGKGVCITTAVPNCWIGVEFPFPVRVRSYSFNSIRACNRAAGRMKSWILEGAMEKSSNWVPLHIRHGEAVDVFTATVDPEAARSPCKFIRIRGPVQQEAGYGLAITEWNMSLITPEEVEFEMRSKKSPGKGGDSPI